jgi:DNA-binding transcriptional ArsR family regulator
MSFNVPERMRGIRDARVLRGLAHPLRARLLEYLVREGSLTATQASELTGESPANCSFHLRTLARYGLARPLPARGREHPWGPASIGHQISNHLLEDAESRAAADAYAAFAVERHQERIQAWLRERHHHPPEWEGTAGESILYLTAEELAGLRERLVALATSTLERMDPARRPAGARPVQLIYYAFPIPPTPGGN